MPKVEFLKDESIVFSGDINKITYLKKGDIVDVSKINDVSPTLLQFYLSQKMVKMINEQTKKAISSSDLQNKAITNLDNKTPSHFNSEETSEDKKLEDLSIQELRQLFKEKGIGYSNLAKRQWFINKLKEENNV